MKRSNFALGLGVSIVGHAALLLWLRGGTAATAPVPAPAPAPPMPIQIASVDPRQLLPLEPLPAPPEAPPPSPPSPPPPSPPVAPTPQTQAVAGSLPLPLERVVEPPPAARAEPPPPPEPRKSAPALARRDTAPPVPSPGPVAAKPPDPVEPVSEPVPDEEPAPVSGRGQGEFVPPLRVHWKDARELISVARTLGMRLAAVDSRGEIIGEIALSDSPGLKTWGGLPYGYSNRVRMLSPSIFSSPLEGAAEIREIWVFVPSDRDRAMVEAQKRAVQRAGARMEDVAAVDGRFVRAANGSYRLDITNIRWRNG